MQTEFNIDESGYWWRPVVYNHYRANHFHQFLPQLQQHPPRVQGLPYSDYSRALFSDNSCSIHLRFLLFLSGKHGMPSLWEIWSRRAFYLQTDPKSRATNSTVSTNVTKAIIMQLNTDFCTVQQVVTLPKVGDKLRFWERPLSIRMIARRHHSWITFFLSASIQTSPHFLRMIAPSFLIMIYWCPEELLCTEEAVLQMLLTLDTLKSSGADGISAAMLKATATAIDKGITALWNWKYENN